MCELCGNTSTTEIETLGEELGYDAPLTVCKEDEGCNS